MNRSDQCMKDEKLYMKKVFFFFAIFFIDANKRILMQNEGMMSWNCMKSSIEEMGDKGMNYGKTLHN